MDWESFMEQWDAVLQFVVIGQDWDDPVTLGDLVVATLIVFLANVVSRGLRRALTPLATRMRPYLGEAVVKVTLRVIHWVVLLLGVVVALNTIGVSLDSLSGLFTAGAVVTVAVGFAMQNIAQNFVSGAILAAERSIKSGDVVEVEGRVLRVQRMGIRTTVARSRDDEEIIIPNATLVQNAVKNFTYQDSIYRLRAQVGVAYDSDMRRVMDTLRAAADALDWRVKTKQPLIFMSAFGDSSVTFEVSVWMNDPWRAPQARSDLMEAIWWALKQAGITIAFPQVDVHFDSDVVAAVRARGSGPEGAPESSSSPHRS